MTMEELEQIEANLDTKSDLPRRRFNNTTGHIGQFMDYLKTQGITYDHTKLRKMWEALELVDEDN